MKKPIHDELELQLQEYTWQTETTGDRRIEFMTGNTTEVEFADTGEERREYRH